MHIYNFDDSFYDTVAEINLSSLKKNFNLIKKESRKNTKSKNKEVKICSIVKANAYGHGIYEISKALTAFGTDYLGTSDYIESLSIKKYLNNNSKRKVNIICLGTLPENKKFLSEIVSNDIEVSATDIKTVELLNRVASTLNKKPKVHIQFDTGMNRVGITFPEILQAVKKISEFKNVKIKGIFSHFATSEIKNENFAKQQIHLFTEVVRFLENEGIKFELKHFQNTGGIFNYRRDFFNMVRPGISLYGYYPEQNKPKDLPELKPVMNFKSKINQIKTVPGKTSISYGRKYFTKREEIIASVPVGYGDGFYRGLTNNTDVMIRNKKYPVVGTVCMDWVMVNLKNNSNIKRGERVLLFGKDFPAYHIAKKMNTLPYEILCNISTRVKRIYIK